MKKTDNSLRVNKKLISAIAILLIVFLCVGVVFAAVTYISAKGKIELITVELNAKSAFSYTEESTDFTFTKPGEQKEIRVTTTNSATPSVLRVSYSFQSSNSDDNKLSQAVLVYFNGDYIGTLKELTDTTDGGGIITGSYVGAGDGNTATDTFTLELHLGAENSLYNGKELTLTTSAYTENADYTNNIFVSTTAELNRAIDDVNSGLLDETNIVLISDVAFGNINTLEQSCMIDLNGHTLSGEAVLNGENACLNVIGKGSNSANYTLTKYDETAVNALLLSAAQTALKDGVKGGSENDLFGHIKFYSPSVTVSGGATVKDGVLTAESVTRSTVETLTFGTNTLEFTILDTATALTADSLKNIPNDGETIVTSDLYLPASIRSEGTSIEWTSSDESVMDATGRITASYAEKIPVTLYATIRVNNAVYSQKFSFLVSAHTNEINFYKLVATVSPFIFYETGNVTDGTGLYQLPLVNKNSAYDYRQNYVTPAKTAQTGENPLQYEWAAYPEIFLSDLSYSLLIKEDGSNVYPYIDIQDSCVYLKQDTLNTYAEISVTGTFETGETYESRVRIIIATGTDTNILEEAFNYAQESLRTVDILKNILATRVESGMANEKGDFTLPASYTAQNGNVYQISYTASTDIITEIKKANDGDSYTVKIDPLKFSDTETNAAITTTVAWGETSRSKTMYFSVPAAVHAADLGNATIFNSVKYQVFMQLPDSEREGDNGFKVKVNGDTITNSNPDYILLRDIVGDTAYKADGYYSLDGDYLYENAETYDGCKELRFYTASNSADYTDIYARDLAALINWATGTGTGAAKNAVTNTTALGSYGDTLSNGKEYLNDSEVAVIKNYYCNITEKSDAEWETLWNRVAEKAPGYIITKGAELDKYVTENLVTGKTETETTQLYFQYLEVLQWATNVRDNVEGGDVQIGATFALGQFKYDFVTTSDTKAPTSGSITVRETRNGTTYDVEYTYFYTDSSNRKWYYHSATYTGSGSSRIKYNIAKGSYSFVSCNYDLDDKNYASYLEDDTDYISSAEAQVLCAYWLGNKGINDTNAKGFIDKFIECTTTPVYFTSEGVQALLSSLYSDADITINGAFTTAAVAAQTDGELNASGGKLQGTKVPAIVNLEDLSTGISYFSGLTSLYICGSEVLPSFLSEYGLNSALSRITSTAKNLETLVMQHVADGYVSFDLNNIKKLSALKQLDVSDNHGVTNLSALVNINSGNYTYVDFSHVNVSKEFQEYALTNLHGNVYYSETESETRKLYEGAKAANAALTYLDELEQIIAEKMFAATQVTDGTAENTVYWRIESGNKITLVSSAGTAVTIALTSEMQKKISPYYYCATAFSYNGMNFESGCVYSFSYADNGAVTSVTKIATDVEKVTNITDAANNYTVADSVLESGKTLVSSGTTEKKSATSVATNTKATQSYTVHSDSYTITFTCYQFYRTYNSGRQNYRYHLYDNGSTLAATSGSQSDTTTQKGALFCFLTEEEYFLASGQKELTAAIEVGNTATGDELYIYFPETGRFLAVTATGSWRTLEYTATANIVPFSVQSGYTISYSGSYINLAISNNNNATVRFSTSTTNSNLSRSDGGTQEKTITYYSSITVDGTTEYKAQSFGYEIMETVTTIVTTQTQTSDVYSYTSSTYLYWDSSTEAISQVAYTYKYGDGVMRTRQKTDVETKYSYRIWYVDENGAEKDITDSVNTSVTDGTNTITVADAKGLMNGYTDSTISGTYSDDWESGLTAPWVKQTPEISEYISYVSEASEENINEQTGMVGLYVQYTGTTGYDSYYNRNTTAVNSAVRYQNNTIYQMTVSGGALTWTEANTTAETGGTGNMDGILDEANTHFNDLQYGNYYGMYYAYNGNTITTTSGNTYTQYGVYRLMPNENNTAFEFVYVQQYITDYNISEITNNIANDSWSNGETNASLVGRIFRLKSGGSFGANFANAGAFYLFVYNEDNGSYSVKTFCNADYEYNSTTEIVGLVNCRPLTQMVKLFGFGSDHHTGTGGTYTVTVTAFVRAENGVEYARRYSVDIVG